MLKIGDLIKSVSKEFISEVTVSENSEIDFDCRNACYIIKNGELLSYGENKFTQLLKTNDPIGVAETILGRSNKLKYRRYQKVVLYRLDGDTVREQINSAGPLVKSIIKYSLRRIFQSSDDDKAPLLFEQKFLSQNEKDTKLRKFEEGTWIFRSGFSNNRMYFLEKGSVQLYTKNNRELATLQMGTCFGESTLIRGKKHNNSAFALEDCLIRTIDEEIIERNLICEAPLVQLILYLVLRRVEFMNSLRMTDDFSKS
jgi:CRP-like cAMP-binding protein